MDAFTEEQLLRQQRLVWKENTFHERWFADRDNYALAAARRAVVRLGWAPPGVWWGPAPGRDTDCVPR